MVLQGPLLFKRPAPEECPAGQDPRYAVMQDDETEEPQQPFDSSSKSIAKGPIVPPKSQRVKHVVTAEVTCATCEELAAKAASASTPSFAPSAAPSAGLRAPSMTTLQAQAASTNSTTCASPRGASPAMVIIGALYGLHYDIHDAQRGIAGTPEGARMRRVYDRAEKYTDEVEHTYSFVQVTACTASFAHGVNDVANAVGPWAVI